MMEKQDYGFFIEEYANGLFLDCLKTGDGRTTFANTQLGSLHGLAIGYNKESENRLGETEDINKPANKDMGFRWHIVFENTKSVDAMISCLERIKSDMNPPKE
jgi:hypothetical protein